MIHVIATVHVAPGRRADFLNEFRRIVPEVRREPGCLEYGSAVDAPTDIPQQHATGADVVTIIEKWDSVTSLKAHLAAPHMTAYRERVKSFVQRVQLSILEPAP